MVDARIVEKVDQLLSYFEEEKGEKVRGCGGGVADNL